MMKQIFFSFILILMGAFATSAVAADAITTGNVNLRSGPGVKYAKRSTIPAGYRLNVQRCQGNWCQVGSRRGSGWVSTKYLAFNQGTVSHYRRAPVVRTPVVVIMPFYIGAPRYSYYRTYRHRGPRYRTHYPRHHRATVRRSYSRQHDR